MIYNSKLARLIETTKLILLIFHKRIAEPISSLFKIEHLERDLSSQNIQRILIEKTLISY